MPRSPRLQIDGIFHVTARGNRREAVFLDDGDRHRFITLLGEAVSRFRWRCHAYCLMGNHYHLIIEAPEANLSVGMCWLNGIYARAFNRRHGFDGHLFQARFHAVLVDADAHMLEVSRYVVLNPVRAGLCDHARQWAWSSYAATAGFSFPPPLLTVGWLLGQFGRTVDRAQVAYRAFVDDAHTTRGRSALMGNPGWIKRQPSGA